MAERQKSLKKNFLMNVLLTLSNFIFPLITFPYVSRILLPIGTGRVTFAVSLISYFVMFAQLGIPTYGIRAVAKVRDDREKLTRTVQELFIINLVMSAAAYALLLIALFTVPRLFEDRTLYLIVSLNIFFSLIGIEWMYKGLEQYTYITVRSIIFKFIALIAMFVLIHKQADYVIYGGISIFASSASAVLNFINARRYISLKPTGGYSFRPHLKAVAIFFAMAVATTVYTNLDVVMLKFMTTDADVGYYNAAVKVKIILVSIVTSLGAVLLPRASYYVEHHEMDRFHEITGKALNFVFLFAAPVSLYFTLFARPGILFLSGRAYGGSVLPMQIIMPTVLFIGITNILGIQVLVPTNREKHVLYSEIIGAVTDIVLNALLIPRMHAAGAAVGTLAAELSVLIYQYAVLRKEMRSSFKAVHYVRILIGLVLGAAASCWVPILNLNNFVTLLISAVLFFGVYGGWLALLKEPLVLESAATIKKKLKH